MPANYDIPYPYPYALAPRKRTSKLLATYAAAIGASIRATEVLDELAAAIGAPSMMLGVHRNIASQQANARPREGTGLAPGQLRPAPPPTAPGQAAQIEHLLHSLQITEPALLLRATAIDQATHDLLAEATAKSRKQDSAAAPLPQRSQKAPNWPARAAGKDLPRHISGRDGQVTHTDQKTAPTAVTASKNSIRLRMPGTQSA